MNNSRHLYKVAAMDAILVSMTNNTLEKSRYGLAIISTATGLRNATEAFGALATTRDQTITLAAHEKRVATAANKLKAQAKVSNEKCQAALRDGLGELAARIASKVKLQPNEHAKEIREVFREMATKDQLQLLKELSDSNRGPELAAIIEVPAILSGIAPELQNVYREQIVYLHARPEFDEQKALLDAVMPAMTVARVADETADELAIGPNRLKQIEDGEAAANAAQNTFNEAVR